MGSVVAALPNKDTPLSVIALQIVKEALKPEASPASLARMAEQDPAFALRIIAVVNSAAFGFARRVSDVKQAAALLGVRGLRSLGLSLALSDMVPVGEEGQALLANSLRRAIASQLLAERFGERERDAYFTAGLFLEVGLLARARDDLPTALQIARSPANDRVIFERAVGGADHPTRGAELAAAFHLPEETIDAIRRHHDPNPPETIIGKVTWLAERIAGVWEAGEVTQARAIALEGCLRLGLDDDDLVRVVNRLPELVTQAGGAFDREVGAQRSYENLMVDVNRGFVELTHSYENVVRRLEILLKEKEELTLKLADANDQLERLARTDALTGLANKRALEEALYRDLSRADRDKTNLAVAIVDVDHFKQVNDRHGHSVGDIVLARVAQLLATNLRSGDLATRYGGEEFVLILPGSNAFGAKLAAERLRKVLEKSPIAVPGEPLTITASFGVASVCGPGCGRSGKELLERADAALYAAKRNGRNRVVMDGEAL
jgi:diguanylate cyclase (GGDEF)-like protein